MENEVLVCSCLPSSWSAISTSEELCSGWSGEAAAILLGVQEWCSEQTQCCQTHYWGAVLEVGRGIARLARWQQEDNSGDPVDVLVAGHWSTGPPL